MQRAEVVWWRIIGVLLILLGAVLLANPRVPYSKSEQIPQTRYSVNAPKIVVIPRAVAVLVLAAGVAAVVLAGKDAGRS